MKSCFRCKIVKKLTEFYQTASNKDGLTGICKECICASSRKYRVINKKRVTAFDKLRSKLPHRREANKRWAVRNRDCIKRINTKYAQSDKGRMQRANYIRNNRDRLLEIQRIYHAKHRDRIRLQNQARRHNDIDYRVRVTLRNNLTHALKRQCVSKNRRPTLGFLGCSIPDFKIYIESKFESGMTWENYGRNGWQIDHIMPCAIFDLSKEHHLKRCFHFSNLQPMWARENQTKGSKILTSQFSLI